MQYFDFEKHEISRVFKGNWQLAGGHGQIDQERAVDDLFVFAEHGINTFDVGDIYTGAEETLGVFLKAYGEMYGAEEAAKLRVHTKFVPDLNALEDLTKEDIRAVIERSLGRLGLQSLHLVQFHWWDYTMGDVVQAAQYLDELRQEGLIEAIGLTNFDCEHTQQLLDAGIPIVSNQIQFSLIDYRPFNGMLKLAQNNDIDIFCYGTLAGGLLGSSESKYDPNNRSHIKYDLMIKETGVEHYQEVLQTLTDLAQKYVTSVANIAIQFVLQTPGVSSAIIGPRNTRHIKELDQLDGLILEEKDYALLERLAKKSLLKDQDIYSYERDFTTPHAQIMQYNNNHMRDI